MNRTRFITETTVYVDGNPIEVEIHQDPASNGIFGVESSFLDQNEVETIREPFNEKELLLDDPTIPDQPSKKKVKPVCKECGSNDIKFDAWASWNVETQQTELDQVFEAAWCEKCEDFRRVIDVSINPNNT